MKALAVAALCCLPCLPFGAAAQAAAQPEALRRLSWLAGCWVSESGEAGNAEQWMPVAGGTMIGMSRMVKNGRTLEVEFMQIRMTTGDRVVLIVDAVGNRVVTFELVRQDDREAVFENLQQDYPQRVIYRRGAGGQLAARTEGLRNGVLRGVDSPLRRENCDPPVERLTR